jgi:hypothetical protein
MPLSPAERALMDLVEASGRVDTAKGLLSDAQGRKRSDDFLSKLETLLKIDLENLEEKSRKFCVERAKTDREEGTPEEQVRNGILQLRGIVEEEGVYNTIQRLTWVIEEMDDDCQDKMLKWYAQELDKILSKGRR